MNNVFCFPLKTGSKTTKVLYTLIRVEMNSVEVLANKRVLASIKESLHHIEDPSDEMLSKQATIDGRSIVTLSRASILSIHLVLHRSLSFWTLDSGWVF